MKTSGYLKEALIGVMETSMIQCLFQGGPDRIMETSMIQCLFQGGPDRIIETIMIQCIFKGGPDGGYGNPYDLVYIYKRP